MVDHTPQVTVSPGSVNVGIHIHGVPELLGFVRREVANLIREVAAKEQEPRVVARLFEIAALLNQTVSGEEAKEAIKKVF